MLDALDTVELEHIYCYIKVTRHNPMARVNNICILTPSRASYINIECI
jgi:hypothetical protein